MLFFSKRPKEATDGSTEPLSEAINKVAEQLATIHADLVKLNAKINQLHDSLTPTPPLAPDPAIQLTHDLGKLLSRAAGIAYAKISCHRDTWDFLVARSAHGKHFRLPGVAKEKDDYLVDADLSGRTLIAVIDALWHTQQAPGEDTGTRHMAAKVYNRIGDALKKAKPGKTPPQKGEEAQKRPAVTQIVIDDRPVPASG